MIFRLANWAVMGVALFYAAEGFGVLERGKYFPTLPRLEASAADPAAWLGAVQWGVSALANHNGATAAAPTLWKSAQAEPSHDWRPHSLGRASERPSRVLSGYYGG